MAGIFSKILSFIQIDESTPTIPKRPQFFTRECFNSGNTVVVTLDSKEDLRVFEFIEKDGDVFFIRHSDCVECNFDSFFYKGQKMNELETKHDDVIVKEKGMEAVKVLNSLSQQDNVESAEYENGRNSVLHRSATDSRCEKGDMSTTDSEFNGDIGTVVSRNKTVSKKGSEDLDDENVVNSGEVESDKYLYEKENKGENRGNWFTQTDDEIEENSEKEEKKELVVNYRFEKCYDDVDVESEIEDTEEESSRSINRYAESGDDNNSFTEDDFGPGRSRKARTSGYLCYEVSKNGLDGVEAQKSSDVREVDFKNLKTSGNSQLTDAQFMNCGIFKSMECQETRHEEVNVMEVVEDMVLLQNQNTDDIKNLKVFLQEVMEESERRTEELQKIFQKE